MEEQDYQVLAIWYRRGEIKTPWMPENMEAEDFIVMLRDHLAFFDEVAVVEGDGARRIEGLMATRDIGDRGAEPHALWMPWATPRAILTAVAQFLDLLRRKKWGIIIAAYDERELYVRMAQLGLLRRVGTFHGYPYLEGRAVVFETMEPD